MLTRKTKKLIIKNNSLWDILCRWDRGDVDEKDIYPPSRIISSENDTDDFVDALGVFRDHIRSNFKADEMFGVERSPNAYVDIFKSVHQTFGGDNLMSGAEEVAATGMYYVAKNHPFVDGNKRISAFVFLWLADRNGILSRSQPSPAQIAALVLSAAGSEPSQKDNIIRDAVGVLNTCRGVCYEDDEMLMKRG